MGDLGRQRLPASVRIWVGVEAGTGVACSANRAVFPLQEPPHPEPAWGRARAPPPPFPG